MNILQSIVLGIIQGITEFFPISSSGHLVVLPYFLDWNYIPLYYTVTVHFATLCAVVTVFYREIFRIIKAVILAIFIRGKRSTSSFKIGIFIIVASIPAAVAGMLLENYVENLFSQPIVVGMFLLVTALMLWLGEFRGKHIEEEFTSRISDLDGNNTDIVSEETKENNLIGEISLTNKSNRKVRFNLFIAIIDGIGLRGSFVIKHISISKTRGNN